MPLVRTNGVNLGLFISGLTQPSRCTYPSHADDRVWRFELGLWQEVQLAKRVSLLGHWSVPLGEGLSCRWRGETCPRNCTGNHKLFPAP